MNINKLREINFIEENKIKQYKTLDYLLEGCQIIGSKWRYIYLNDAAAKHGHRTKKELLGHTMMEVYPGIENTDMFFMLRNCMEKHIPHRIENEFTYPDNTKGWFELRIEPVPDGVFVLSIDISERKQAELRVKYLNTALTALRNINQLITREKNREQLIQKSCDLMVENRGFLSAWILLIDNQNKFISAAGAGSKEMQTIYINQLKQGNYPECVEKILAHKQSFAICETIIGKKQDCFPGRFSSNGKGFISLLEYAEKVYGVISAYVPSAMVYDPEEKSLFQELAGDVSYALNSIEKEEERKRTEEELFLRSQILTNMAEGVNFIQISSLSIIYTNPKFDEMFGYQKDELIGKKISVLNAPGKIGPRKLTKEIIEHLNKNSEWHGEIYSVKKDGTLFWCLVDMALFEHATFGKAAVSIYQDITKRKETEEELRISESLYHSLFENMLNGFAYCKMLFDNGKPYDFVYLMVNSAFETQTGLKGVAGKKVSEVIPGIQKSDSKLLETYGRVALTGNPETFETYINSLDMWFSVSVYSPQKEYFMVVFDVITERKKAEESLKFSNALLITQQETSIDGILVVDDDGKILSFNKRFVDIWGIPSKVIESRSDASTLKSVLNKLSDPDHFLKKVNYLYTHKDEKSYDEITLKDGRTLDRYSSPMLDIDNKYYGRVWYFRDITRRKNDEKELKNSYTALKKNLTDVIDTMAKIVEMRDPYTAGHQRRVAYLATAIATEMDMNDNQKEQVSMAAMIHDIGKIYVPSTILAKPGKLTDIEFQLIKTHAKGGYDIIKGIDFPFSIAQSILQHHERLDGSGYPQGLKGKQICLEAKILGVADVVEAIASHRPYRPTLGIEKALEEIELNKGIKYDPDIVDICLKLFRKKTFMLEMEEKN